MPSGNVLEKISSEYYQLTNAEKKAADYAVIHQQKTQLMSISELIEKVGVAETTTFRFHRRLDYKGYSTSKLAIANSTARRVGVPTVPGEIRPEDGIEELCQKLYAADRDAMAQTVELIYPDSVRRTVGLLFSAEKVLCTGQGGSMTLAQECVYLFGTAWPNLYAVLDFHTQTAAASHLTARGVVLYFSYSGSTEELLRSLKIIRDRRAVAISITQFPRSLGVAYADVVLQCSSLEGLLQGGSVAARVAQLYLMDVLLHEVYRRDVQGSAETGEVVAKVLPGEHI